MGRKVMSRIISFNVPDTHTYLENISRGGPDQFSGVIEDH